MDKKVTKIMGKLLPDNFLFLPPSLFLTLLRLNEENLRRAMLWVENIV